MRVRAAWPARARARRVEAVRGADALVHCSCGWVRRLYGAVFLTARAEGGARRWRSEAAMVGTGGAEER
jgi:hypothetical protein